MKNFLENKYKSITIDSYILNFIDVGSGDVILFSHGTPSSSFQFRELIEQLSKNYRCVSIDLLGFGLSDKPIEADYSPKAHSVRLRKVIEKLEISPKYIYGHDFGLPIVIGAFFDENIDKNNDDINPELTKNIEKIFISNSWLWDLRKIKYFNDSQKYIPNWLAKFLYIKMNFSPKVLLKLAFYDKNKLTNILHNEYLKPFIENKNRISLFKLYEELLNSGDWYETLFNKREKFKDIDKILIWGMNDKLMPDDKLLPIWENNFDNLTIENIFECGHFLEEEQPIKIINIFNNHLKS